MSRHDPLGLSVVRLLSPLCASCGCPPSTQRRGDCEHDSLNGVDTSTGADKVWCCAVCDALVRFEQHDGIAIVIPLCGCGRCSGWMNGGMGWWPEHPLPSEVRRALTH